MYVLSQGIFCYLFPHTAHLVSFVLCLSRSLLQPMCLKSINIVLYECCFELKRIDNDRIMQMFYLFIVIY